MKVAIIKTTDINFIFPLSHRTKSISSANQFASCTSLYMIIIIEMDEMDEMNIKTVFWLKIALWENHKCTGRNVKAHCDRTIRLRALWKKISLREENEKTRRQQKIIFQHLLHHFIHKTHFYSKRKSNEIRPFFFISNTWCSH